MNILRIGTLVLFAILFFVRPEADQTYLYERNVLPLLDRIQEEVGTAGATLTEVKATGDLPAAYLEGRREEMAERFSGEGDADSKQPLVLSFGASDAAQSVTWTWRGETHVEEKAPIRAVSVLPPLLAIAIALLFQRTILALASGAWLGATFLSGNNPLLGLWLFFREYIIQQALFDSFRLELIGFVIGLVALVGVISRGGGVQGMILQITKLVRSARSSQVATYIMGLMIFFDDYANTILVGNTMRPLTDRFRVSREKLAYIVDSTAAPVAGISILSTWAAYEVSLFSGQLIEVGITENPYLIFVQTIPYRFYSIFTLLFILFGILTGREYGPMLKAERRARSRGQLSHPDARPMVSDAMTRVQAKENVPHRWWNGALPLITVIVVTLVMMWRSGNASLDAPYPLSAVFSLGALRDVIANANSTQAIAGGAWTGFLLAALLMLTQKNLTPIEVLGASFNSTRALFFAIVILLLAWCIGGVCRDMGTAYYLVALFKQSISPNVYPIVLFLVSCLVSFSTGSSWSTMAIILPNAVLLAHLLGADSVVGSFGLTIVSIGAVLEGSIFGDHCSPLSDTTILSSVSSASDHIHHVRTQIPYAMTTMIVAILAGYLPATRGVSPWICLACGAVAMLLVIRFVGKKPEEGIEAGQRT